MSSPSDRPLTSADVRRRFGRVKRSEEVARRLLGEIQSRRLGPGERLPSERDLMVSFGAGRSTIREAINGLAMLGVVEIRHGLGAFVAESAAGLDASHTIAAALARGVTRDLIEARQLIEVHTAALAAQRRGAEDLAELARMLEEHARAVPADIAHDVRFHVRLAWASRNEMLSRAVESFGALLASRPGANPTTVAHRDCEVTAHRAILDAVQRQETSLAASLMAAHLTTAVLWERPGRGDPPWEDQPS